MWVPVLADAVSHPIVLLGMLSVAPLLIVLLGIWPLRRIKVCSGVVPQVVAHGLAWAAVAVGMLYWIPRAKKVLEDFDVELPAFTRLIIAVDDVVLRGWLPFLALLVGIVAADGCVLFILWKQNAKAPVRLTWSVLMTVLPLVIVVVGEVAMFFPLVKLFNELS